MQRDSQFDYVAVGHITIDVMPDGSTRPGGSALYGALQASRLGLRAFVLTRGVRTQIEALIEPFADELELSVQPACETTTLRTAGMGSARRQHVLAWAGAIEPTQLPVAAVLHLAPVARELDWRPPAWQGFVGLTPQGLARRWASLGGELSSCAPTPGAAALATGVDALVVSRLERESCAQMIELARASGALVAITAGHASTEILLGSGGERREVPVEQVDAPADDLGAGDVYASTLFVTLAQGASVDDAAELAGDAAALRMLGVGAQAVAGRAEIEALRARRAAPR